MPRFREWPINLNDLCFMFFMGFVLKAIGNLSSLLRLRLKQHSGYSRTSGSISHQMQRKRRRRPHLPCAGAKPEEVHFCWSDCCNTWWNQIHTSAPELPILLLDDCVSIPNNPFKSWQHCHWTKAHNKATGIQGYIYLNWMRFGRHSIVADGGKVITHV